MLAKKLLAAALLASFSSVVLAQNSGSIRGEFAAGDYRNLITSPNFPQVLQVAPRGIDPCASADVAKSTTFFSVSSATTGALVSGVANQFIYVCHITMTISQVATIANTIKFGSGTGTNCATTNIQISGIFGAGGVTAGPPITITTGGEGTKMKTLAAGDHLCVTTAIGSTGNFNGIVSYVQQ